MSSLEAVNRYIINALAISQIMKITFNRDGCKFPNVAKKIMKNIWINMKTVKEKNSFVQRKK